jgi:hypothetical protein
MPATGLKLAGGRLSATAGQGALVNGRSETPVRALVNGQ